MEGIMTKAAVLDTSLQRTHEWLRDIGHALGFDNERAAYAALRATLHAVRDRLPVELVAHLGAEMPMLVRGIYYEGWHPSAIGLKAAHADDFCESMRGELQGHGELQDAERVARSVLRVIDQRIAPGQVERVLDALPRGVRELWSEARQKEAVR
jgi:uncharacterized protein (DUF2267 family)